MWQDASDPESQLLNLGSVLLFERRNLLYELLLSERRNFCSTSYYSSSWIPQDTSALRVTDAGRSAENPLWKNLPRELLSICITLQAEEHFCSTSYIDCHWPPAENPLLKTCPENFFAFVLLSICRTFLLCELLRSRATGVSSTGLSSCFAYYSSRGKNIFSQRVTLQEEIVRPL